MNRASLADLAPRAVIWDVDGVLIDSEPLHYEAARAALARSPVALAPEENVALLGRSLPEVWLYLSKRGLDTPRQAWIGEVEAHYLAGVHAGMARRGVIETVGALTARGVPQACVSTAERRILDANVAALGIGAALRFTISREDVVRTKPAPDPYVAACARLGLAPGDCLAIEDTPVGVAAARAAGVPVLAWPHALTAQLDFPGATARIARLDEVPFLTQAAGDRRRA
ncbi:HAD family hydrolase [Salinarimonas chemoclinalis]|uniref:HAD family hydrolase n=1 Tax=Salinarimonas chemoclinalis TaxID=3241599 RepID=UPI00355844DB